MAVNTAAVVFVKEYLTGLSAGAKRVDYIVCNSRKSAHVLAKDMRETKVMAGELSSDLYKVSKVKVVSFVKALPFDVLDSYKKFL